MDWFVLLSPLLVLAVIALLGFTGCFTKPERPRPFLTLKATIPAELAVPLAEFQWTEPGSAPSPPDTAPGRSVDGAGNTVLTHVLDDPVTGTWVAGCRVQVVDALGQGNGSASGTFVLDAEMPDGDVTFTGFGTSQTFNFVFSGLFPHG